MPPLKPNFLTNVHLFRGLAILPVVATHLLFEMHWPQELVWEFKICLSVVQNGTVPFVFVAGLLFQHRLGSYRYANYLRSKLRYVAVPYLVVSLPFVLLQHGRKFGMFAPSRAVGSNNIWLDTAVTYLSGAQMAIPLWFIPMICTFYLLAPAFACLDRRPKSYWILPFLLAFASFAHRPALQPQLGHSLLYFLPVYVTGMWVSHYLEPVLAAVSRHRLALVALIAATIVFEVLTRERPGAVESASIFSTERGIFDVNLYQKLAASVLVLELLRHAGPILHKLLDPVADVSFGIFFTHYYLIYFGRDVLKQFGSSSWTGSAAAVAVMSLVVVALCTLFSFGLRRVVGHRSRYLIGC